MLDSEASCGKTPQVEAVLSQLFRVMEPTLIKSVNVKPKPVGSRKGQSGQWMPNAEPGLDADLLTQ